MTLQSSFLFPSGSPPVSAAAMDTAHVLFVHGWLGSELVLADNPNHVIWGDQSVVQARALVQHRQLLTAIEAPRPLIPSGLRSNYRNFFEGLRFLGGFHDPADQNLTAFVYDWRLGMPEASAGLNDAIDLLPTGTVIVAHSYGSLVVLYAIASGGIAPANLAKIKRVIVLAPPYFGTTFAMLGLARSGDFMRKAGDFLPSLMKTLFAFAANTPDFLTNYIAPVFGSFQSLYDMIPHDLATQDLQVLAIRGLDGHFTSQRWPYWTATEDAREKLRRAREAQRALQRSAWPVDTVAILSDTENTPHRCTATDRPPYTLTHLADELGDGIVAGCCAQPAGATLLRLDFADKAQLAATGHNQMLHHPKTKQLLEGLLR
jgi:hypothetical protein